MIPPESFPLSLIFAQKLSLCLIIPMAEDKNHGNYFLHLKRLKKFNMFIKNTLLKAGCHKKERKIFFSINFIEKWPHLHLLHKPFRSIQVFIPLLKSQIAFSLSFFVRFGLKTKIPLVNFNLSVLLLTLTAPVADW